MPPLWGDGSLWGDGDQYYSALNKIAAYVAYSEVKGNRIALVIHHSAEQTPGVGDTFCIHNTRLMLAPARQIEHDHEAYVDFVTPAERIALQVHFSGEDIQIENMRLKASRKRFKRG